MSNSVEAISVKYLTTKKLSGGTRKEYKSTVTKWTAWGNGVDVDQINRSHIRDFLDWVHEQAAENGGSHPGRTANRARENLRAIMSWAWEQDYVAKLPRFTSPKPQRDVAGRHYLTKPDLNALYSATYQLPQLRGWKQPFTVGHMESIPGRCSGLMDFTSQYCGDTCHGVRSRQTVRAKSVDTVGCTTAE